MSTLRMEDIIHAMELVKRPAFDTLLLPAEWANELPPYKAPVSMFGGLNLRVVESPLARMPAKVHKRRSGMSAAYHRRVQKKWTKRYGYVPAAFFIDSGKLLGAIKYSPFDIHSREGK